MSTKVPFRFEEFYEAFGKSVSSDVIFEDGQVHIVHRAKELPPDDIASKKPTSPKQLPSTNDPEKTIPQKHAKGRLLDSADRRRLPWSIRALLEVQEPDGSWAYSSNFAYIINGTAPPPMEGISGKMWATAIAITVWRQYPEYFELLETYYEKAMLHADENVLHIVRSVLQFDSLDQVPIREQLAREAAAKRELELNEELKIARMREEEIRIGKLSLVHARRLPMPTQQLFVSELGNEAAGVFSALPPDLQSKAESIAKYKVGQLVESCRRRRTNVSVLTVAISPPRWHPCRVAAIDEQSLLVQLDFLDGDRERESRVPIKFIRPTAAGAHEIRAAQFEALKRCWSQPIVCEAEIARLEEARAIKLQPLPWNYRHHLASEEPASGKPEETGQGGIAKPTSRQRPRSSARWTSSSEVVIEDPDRPVDSLFQTAAVILMRYDRALARVQEAAQTGSKRYAAAVLYRDRFHAFDELAASLMVLVEGTVGALEAIWRWKHGSPSTGPHAKTFIWKGDDFIVAVRSPPS
ncbi:unnamed protein product [Phytophthora lilii]|uniref:Unnamed protein product n=1 Tax=Phytophthora lilii TaxID=2077276 RepID=A0A9W6TVF9_9STRA|nr:unnamed protein product [Phytophthora lilii]